MISSLKMNEIRNKLGDNYFQYLTDKEEEDEQFYNKQFIKNKAN